MSKFSQRRAEDLITASMREGLYGDDSRLPEYELIKSLSTSRTAVRAALNALSKQGLFRRSPRSGTVANGYWQLRPVHQLTLPDDVTGALRYDVLEQRIVALPDVVRKKFDGLTDSEIGIVEILRRTGRTRISVFTNYVVAPTAEAAAVRCRLLHEKLVVAELGGRANPTTWSPGTPIPDAEIELGSITQTFGATRCDAETAKILLVEPDSPLLWEEIVLRDREDRTLLVTYARHNPYHVGLVTRRVLNVEMKSA